MSGIEWTTRTWNPVVGCEPVSPGCLNCYAATMARRLEAMGVEGYEGRRDTGAEGQRVIRIAEVRAGRAVFTGSVRCLPERLDEPLSWGKAQHVFVCSMSDLFHEAVPFEFIDRVWAVMALCPHLTFQVLTKRPERMREYLARPWKEDGDRWLRAVGLLPAKCLHMPMADVRYPLPNVWLGTSVEDQARADARIPHLLACPAALRFLSCEPLLGAVDLRRWLHADDCPDQPTPGPKRALPRCPSIGPVPLGPCGGIGWVIVGGESGARDKIRPTDIGHIRSMVEQCRDAGVPVFVKQLGAALIGPADEEHWRRCEELSGVPVAPGSMPWKFKDRKGGDPAEWPEDLRVREMPGDEHRAAEPQSGGP